MPLPQDITVIDKSDDDPRHLKGGHGWLVALRAAFPDALAVSSVPNMVTQILHRLGSEGRIGRLQIYGHGWTIRGQGGVQPVFESQTELHRDALLAVDRSGRLFNRDELSRLTLWFAPDGFVELRGCNVGLGHRGRELLRQLHMLWAVPVRASPETQRFADRDLVDPFEGAVIEARSRPGHHARVRRVE